MMIRELTWEQIEELYHGAMQEDFPEGERKPIGLLQSLYERGVNRTYGLYEEDGITRRAYAIFERADKKNAWLLDYLAVDKSARGGGYGTIFLKELQKKLVGVDAIMAEIERIDHAENEAQLLERTRRKRFYLKNGLLETGVFTKADGGIGYEILCLPVERSVTGREAKETMLSIYETFFQPGEYEVYF